MDRIEIQLTASAVAKVERNTKRMIFVERLLSGGRDGSSWRSGMDGLLPTTASIDASRPPLDGLPARPLAANFHQFRRVTRQAEAGAGGDAAPRR